MSFIRFQWQVYQGNPHWVPPLLMDRKKLSEALLSLTVVLLSVDCLRSISEGAATSTGQMGGFAPGRLDSSRGGVALPQRVCQRRQRLIDGESAIERPHHVNFCCHRPRRRAIQ